MRKGNITVTLDKDTYIEKVKEMLQDKETYETIKKDPTNKFTKNLRTLLARWKECNYIVNSRYIYYVAMDYYRESLCTTEDKQVEMRLTRIKDYLSTTR